MNQSNIDYLYQVFTPATDRPAGTSRSEGDAAGFGAHLNQASTSVFDAVTTPYRDTPRTPTSNTPDSSKSESLERQTVAASDAPPVQQSPESGNGSNSRDSSCATCEDTGAEVPGPKSSDADDHDDDEPADSEVAASAVVAHDVQGRQTSPAEAKPHIERAKSEKEIAANDSVAEAGNAPNTVTTADGEQHVPADGGVPAESVELATVTSEPGDDDPTTEHNKRHVKHKGTTATTHKASADEGTKKIAPAYGATEPAAKPTAEATVTVEEQAVPTEAPKGSAATRRTSATRCDADDDRSSRDGKKGENSPSAKGPVGGNLTTGVVAAVARIPLEANTNLASVVEKSSDDDNANTKPVGNNVESAVGPLGRTLRSAVEMTRGHKTANASDAPQVDPARFIGRVARAIHTANERGGALQLRLAPPELGSLKIELNIKDGVMSAALEADNATARRLLLDHLPALRERLAEQHVRVERFDVDVRQDDNSGQANSRGSSQNSYQRQSEHEPQQQRNTTATNTGEQAEPEPSIVATRISSTAINLVI